MKQVLPLFAVLCATPLAAEETRQLDAHEHGVGVMNIAIDGKTVALELEAPGADIVGFEYVAESAEDRAAIEDAVSVLARPLDLFVLPARAECTVLEASAKLKGGEDHDDHDDHAAAHDDHDDHDDHKEHAEAHDDHDDHGHEDHAEANHTEFHAEYTLNCADPTKITEINFAYFDTFENALELEVQVLTRTTAQAFDVPRDAPVLDLRSLF